MGDRLTTIDMTWPKSGDLLCSFRGGELGPNLTQCRLGQALPRGTSLPSGILIYPSVWPQYTNVADRQTGQTNNGPIV